MYKILIGICVITNFTGEPVNKCFLLVDEDRYDDFSVCMERGAEKELNIITRYKNNTDRANIVLQSICVKEEQV